MTENSNQPERPRVEPEIIPPDRASNGFDGRPEWPQRAGRPFISGSGTQRIYVARLGPFGIAVLILIFGILIAVILLAVVGAFLIWVPVIALFVAAGALFRLLRR